MMIKFLARGTGSAAAAADYLTREQNLAPEQDQDQDQDRDPEKNPEEVKEQDRQEIEALTQSELKKLADNLRQSVQDEMYIIVRDIKDHTRWMNAALWRPWLRSVAVVAGEEQGEPPRVREVLLFLAARGLRSRV